MLGAGVCRGEVSHAHEGGAGGPGFRLEAAQVGNRVGAEGLEVLLGVGEAVNEDIEALVSNQLDASADFLLTHRRTAQQVLGGELDAAHGRHGVEELLLVEVGLDQAAHEALHVDAAIAEEGFQGGEALAIGDTDVAEHLLISSSDGGFQGRAAGGGVGVVHRSEGADLMDARTHADAHRGALVLLVFSGAGCSFAGVGAGALGGSRGVRKGEGHPLIVGEIPLVLQSWHPEDQ